jgi:DNA-binding NtrC family response regulator
MKMDLDMPVVLVVDDEKHTRDGLRLTLEEEFEVYVAGNEAEALEHLMHDGIDVMLTDLRLGGDDGMRLLDAALKLPRPPVCIMMTAFGSVDTAVEAMRRGAWHFVTKPVNLDEVELLIKRALRSRNLEQENQELRQQVERKFSVEGILGQSDAMRMITDTISQVAPTRATVLIEGESGTGKELVARAIHHLSGRPRDKMVAVHCAALSPQILESELFGHEKGSFTGATERRIGRFEQANGGTLFLDEIGEIDAATQIKLLRAIGEQTFERVGGNKPIQVDVRVVAATNRDLARMVEEGTFREDLYWRLRVVTLQMPPLRDRKSDLLVLSDYFLKEIAQSNGRPVKAFADDVIPALMSYNWPGNVRELRTVIEHGVVMSNSSKIHLRHLPGYISHLPGGVGLRAPVSSGRAGTHGGQGVMGLNGGGAGFAPTSSASGDLNMQNMEAQMIHEALARCGNSRTEAAEMLGISRRTLQRKIKEMGLIKRKRRVRE